MFSKSSDLPAGQQLQFSSTVTQTQTPCVCGLGHHLTQVLLIHKQNEAQLFCDHKVENSDVYISETYKHEIVLHFDHFTHVYLRQCLSKPVAAREAADMKALVS